MICKIDNHPVYYQEFGTGKPILCIHGFPEDHRTMTGCVEPIMASLDNYRRIYIDLPGLGSTKMNASIKNADDMLDFLTNFIREVIKDESFLLVGLSYGGYLSLGMMLNSGLNISGVFLICPCVISNQESRNLAQKEILVLEKDLKPKDSEQNEFQDFMDYAVIATTKTWERYRNEIMPGLKDADVNFINTYRKDGYGFSFEASLKDINFNKPIVVITGKQDNCVGYEDTWRLVKHLSHLTFVCLDKAGHNLQIENKPLFDFHFHDWLNNCN
ncbi:alpha/beta hydrolase [Clostridium sp. E02]|uniref:alpha/beta fold hydrolase n=1 Tax=Clostridium sp. E02 TaxID=2487134 RepID=UPI000F53D7D2|nr:alpha/beta hydrolase [Clostridium sp. E02]